MPRTPSGLERLMHSPVRTRFFAGKLLTADDLSREQEYHRTARRRMLLAMIGPGVVTGLRISATADGKSVVVSPGMAVDGLGREVIVPESVDVCLEERPRRAAHGGFVVLSYAEEPVNPGPTLHTEVENSDRLDYGAVRETFRVSVRSSRPDENDAEGAIVIGRVPKERARKKKPVKKKA